MIRLLIILPSSGCRNFTSFSLIFFPIYLDLTTRGDGACAPSTGCCIQTFLKFCSFYRQMATSSSSLQSLMLVTSSMNFPSSVYLWVQSDKPPDMSKSLKMLYLFSHASHVHSCLVSKHSLKVSFHHFMPTKFNSPTLLTMLLPTSFFVSWLPTCLLPPFVWIGCVCMLIMIIWQLTLPSFVANIPWLIFSCLWVLSLSFCLLSSQHPLWPSR